MQTTAKEVGLLVNEDKTKYLTLDRQRQRGSRIGQNITMNEFNFEVVQSFKYLGSIINISNDIEEEILMRTTQGNKCFYALRHLFKSSLLSRSTKFKLYRSMVRPIVMYGSETWTLTNKHENMRSTFERKMLLRICGPIQENNVWRTRNNRELSKLFGYELGLVPIDENRCQTFAMVVVVAVANAINSKTSDFYIDFVGGGCYGAAGPVPHSIAYVS